MAQCKWCGRSGFFLLVDANGLCNSCSSIIGLEANQRIRIINDSIKLVRESKKLDTQLSRCDLILEHTSQLMKYEKKGIPVIKPAPSVFFTKYQDMRDGIILNGLTSEFENSVAKLELTTSINTKITQLSKLLLKIRDYKSKTNTNNLLEPLEEKVKDFIHKTQLDSYLEDARKAEFKGQNKKALNKYYEALYFLKHDEIDDKLQEKEISAITSKINELGGELK